MKREPTSDPESLEYTVWIVKWQNGKKRRYVPYDSIGMTAFIKKGLEKGKVSVITVQSREVYIRDDGHWAPVAAKEKDG